MTDKKGLSVPVFHLMKFSIKNDFWYVNGISLLLILVVSFFPNPVLRNILGWPFLLFVPGYSLTAALFPRKTQLDVLGRLTFSIGLSVALLPLIGLLLNATPWGIKLYPILVGVSIFTLIASTTAWYRRRRLPPEERSAMSFRLNFGQWAKWKPLDRALSVVLVLAIVGATGVIVYNILNPRTQEYFTEFYMLGITGKAENYVRDVTVNKPVDVTVGVASHENAQSTYRIEVTISGTQIDEVGPIVLMPGEKWENEIEFTPTAVGDNQKVEFYLYRNQGTMPYLDSPLRQWINVGQQRNTVR
jgi:uncharacterized membrane protein